MVVERDRLLLIPLMDRQRIMLTNWYWKHTIVYDLRLFIIPMDLCKLHNLCLDMFFVESTKHWVLDLSNFSKKYQNTITLLNEPWISKRWVHPSEKGLSETWNRNRFHAVALGLTKKNVDSKTRIFPFILAVCFWSPMMVPFPPIW